MATLRETLGSAKSGSPKYSYSYQPPRIPSPYPNYPPLPSPGAGGGLAPNQSIYSSILAQSQAEAQRRLPSLEFGQPISFDPVLARISAIPSMTEANAKAERNALKKRAFIEAGISDIGDELKFDPQTIESARQRTNAGISGRAILDRARMDRPLEVDNALNTGNLFFSGERVKRHDELNRNFLKTENDFVTGLRDTLTQAENAYLAAAEAERQRKLIEELQRLLSMGYPGPTSAPPPVAAPVAPTFGDPMLGGWPLGLPPPIAQPGVTGQSPLDWIERQIPPVVNLGY